MRESAHSEPLGGLGGEKHCSRTGAVVKSGFVNEPNYYGQEMGNLAGQIERNLLEEGRPEDAVP